LPALGVQDGAVRFRPASAPGHLAPAVEPSLQDLVAERVDLGPVEPGRLGAQHRRADGAVADAEALGDRPLAPAQGVSLTKSRSCVPHGQSLGGHSSPFGWMAPSDRPAPLRSGHPPLGGCPAGGVPTRTDPGGHDADLSAHDRPIRLPTMLRSTWPRSTEARTHAELMAAAHRLGDEIADELARCGRRYGCREEEPGVGAIAGA
jgi:hypothetical protein